MKKEEGKEKGIRNGKRMIERERNRKEDENWS